MPLSAAVSNFPLFFIFSPHSPLPPPRHPSSASPHRLPKAISSVSTPRVPSLLSHAYHLSSDASETAEGIPHPSSAAVAAVIRRLSKASSVEFTQRTERAGKTDPLLPSPDFQRLCIEQLDLFRAVVDPHALLSIYVRPAGSYVMDQLELRQVIYYPSAGISKNEECMVIVGNFATPGGLHTAEIAISRQEVEVVAEFGAIIFPLVKHPFLVGFLVAELPKMKVANCATCEALEPLGFREEFNKSYGLPTSEKRVRAIMISRSLATGYVMDQKSMLLRQTSWQNSVRMGHLIEQIRGSLSSIKALSKMLSLHVKRSEIAYDIADDILMQGDGMKDAIRQLQDAVHLTKANIVQFSDDSVKKMRDSFTDYPDLTRSLPSDSLSRDAPSINAQGMKSLFPPNSDRKDVEVPMPPFLLVPQQEHTIRPYSAAEVLIDLVGAASALACKLDRSLELCELHHPLLVAVDESALRQALSNLIEGSLLRTQIGGKVEIYGVTAPAGGALIVIDDNGPDMHYMTQMHTLAPFGVGVLSSTSMEDSMTWNFVASLAVAREILESYGCVVRVISPREQDAALGAGGTRIELWFPDINPTEMNSAEHLYF